MRQAPMILQLFLVGILYASSVGASDLFTYQGKLTDETGHEVSDGQYRIGVRIWDVATGGSEPLWARKYDVPVQDGAFSLMIGADGIAWEDPAPLTGALKLAVSGTDRFLEITVMSDADSPELGEAQWKVLQPRQKLNAVPYALNGVPPGTVVPFAGVVVPEGWVRCDGSSYPADDARYASLGAALQGAYGAGDGTFSVPDLRGRTVIGVDRAEAAWVQGDFAGSKTASLEVANLPDHTHGLDLSTQNDGSHSHRIDGGRGGDTGSGDGAIEVGSRSRHRNWPSWTTSKSGAHSHRILGNTLADRRGEDRMKAAPFSIIQPSLVLNYIIKL